jgi:hypothetical protein
MPNAKTKVILAFSDMQAEEYVDRNKHNCVYMDYSSLYNSEEEAFEKAFIDAIKYNISRTLIDYIFVDLDYRILKRLMSEKIDFYLLYPFIGEDNYFLEKYKGSDIAENYVDELYADWYFIDRSPELEKCRSTMFTTDNRYFEYRDYNTSITSMMPRILQHKRSTNAASN